ncbi:methionyl-tRNA formyltransferase [Rubidibacter lacunae KORDI 51-2]|uniref:Methionyl-tRNA formyltransferase n=1 Tax=Rubidibacter lacunae KORDI 51-2 TaxID=582515 RepID=U5DJB9_9CHRO|nr:methionyl-tRNA formyltransferase [Rubidibacter lacunae]ERN41791.1 methionyl-tRNA formyltransferase [Rubidibacter lacunae KORDI 51-2]
MRIVFFGTPAFAVPTLQQLLARSEFEVVAAVTQPDKRRGRGKQVMPSPVKQLAEEQGIPVWQPRRIKKDQPTLERLRQAAADAFVVVAYGQILSQAILDMPRLGCVNVHGSLLPKYRGAAPIQWCLHAGETETGIATMLMDAGMDTGAVLLKASVPIAWGENAWQLGDRLADLGATLLVETLLKLERGDIEPLPQDSKLATYAPLIQKADYALDWSRTAIALHNQVRAFYPSCTATYADKPLKILQTVPLTSAASANANLLPNIAALQAIAFPEGAPGEVVHLAKQLGPVVRTGGGVLLLSKVQPSGKKPQSGWDFVNGTRVRVGERLGGSL